MIGMRLLALLLTVCSMPMLSAEEPSLTYAEKKAGWTLLFDGKTTQGWREYKKDVIPLGWQATDGILTRVSGGAGGKGAGGGADIITVEKFASFELSVNGLAVYGGFAGGETDLSQRDIASNVTVLSGDLAANDGPDFANNDENSYHVVTVRQTGACELTVAGTCLDGLTHEECNVLVHGNWLGYGTSTSAWGVATVVIVALIWPWSAWMYRSIYIKPVRRAMRETGYDLCIQCGYELTGLAGDADRCPECGAAREASPETDDNRPGDPP